MHVCRNIGLFWLSALLVSTWGVTSFAKEDLRFENSRPLSHYQTDYDDGVQWKWDGVNCKLTVGDLHGDFNALAVILTDPRVGFVDNNGNWTGGKCHLVLLGDLLDGAPDARMLLDLVLWLTPRAQAAGGHVHFLIGNHDVAAAIGDEEKLDEGEAELLTDQARRHHEHLKRLARELLTDPNSIYAQLFRSVNSIIMINHRFSTHAGLDRWLDTNDPGRINTAVRAGIRSYQGLGPKLRKKLRWVLGIDGTGFDAGLGQIWHRGYSLSWKDKNKTEFADVRPEYGPKRSDLQHTMDLYGAEGVDTGHKPTPDKHIHLTDPYYGNLVAHYDSHISEALGGNVEAGLEKNGVRIPLAFERDHNPPLRRLFEVSPFKLHQPNGENYLNPYELDVGKNCDLYLSEKER